MRPSSLRPLVLAALRRNSRPALLGAGVVLAAGVVYAQGGTAKPPVVSTVPAVNIFAPAGPALPILAPLDNGFSITGMVQAVALTPGAVCSGAPGQTTGGTAMINGVVITIPSDTIVQLPAATMTFADMVCPQNAAAGGVPVFGPSLGFDGLDGTPAGVAAAPGQQASPVLPSIEMRVDGNIVGAGGPAGVGSLHVAGLVYVSQQSANTGSGYISRIDYTDGSIYVSTAGGSEVRLLINDPTGRFGRPQSSPDARFSVDADNPTIKSGSTGYPMCVPRVAPSGVLGVETDPLCPQRNRPTGVAPSVPCRNFAAASLTGFVGGAAIPGPFRAGGDIGTVPINGFCTGFVMKAIAGMPGAATAAALSPSNVNALPLPPNEPDPRQQAPFEVGDFITWAGTLVRQGNVPAAAADPVTNGDLIWVHTIDANVGIYTQPKTLPAYIAIGEFGLGVDPLPTGAAVVIGAESTPRMFLEAVTSDVGSIVDIYTDDLGVSAPTPRAVAAGGPFLPPPVAGGGEYFRWLTPETMTGALTEQAAGKVGWTTSAQPFGGGIESQYAGPQPGRARIRANKVPSVNPAAPGCPAGAGAQGCAVTNSPTRYIRVVLRSLCAPARSGTPDMSTPPVVIPSTNLDAGLWYDINGAVGLAPSLPGTGPGTTVPADSPSSGICLERAQYANGLFAGQYMAPVGEFIFPENTLAGAAIVPANTWQLGFLAYGEGGVNGNSTTTQAPTPW